MTLYMKFVSLRPKFIIRIHGLLIEIIRFSVLKLQQQKLIVLYLSHQLADLY